MSTNVAAEYLEDFVLARLIDLSAGQYVKLRRGLMSRRVANFAGIWTPVCSYRTWCVRRRALALAVGCLICHRSTSQQ